MKAFHPTFPPPPPRPLSKQIFAAHAKVTVPIEYVITVYEACHTLEHKNEAYLRHGLDGDMVETYLDTVLRWNRLLKKN